MNAKTRRASTSPLALVLTLVLAVVFAGLLPPTPQASANTYEVNTTSDHDPDGTCERGPFGDCTLREAVLAAEANPGPDTIVLPQDTYTLDHPMLGDLDATEDLTILGNGAEIFAGWATAGSETRIFDLTSANTELPEFRLVDLRLRGGDVTTDGGAIRAVDADLTLEDVEVWGNEAAGSGGGVYGSHVDVQDSSFLSNVAAKGGAIAAPSAGQVTVQDSTFLANHATDGGAIHFATVFAPSGTGALTVARSSFVENWAEPDGGDAHGGAIDLRGGSAVLQQVLLSENGADLGETPRTTHGGAVHAQTTGSVTILNSTIDDNRATSQGGGLLLATEQVNYVSFSTISANRASGPSGLGGGLLSRGADSVQVGEDTTPAGVTRVINSTISGNTAQAGGAGIQAGTPTGTGRYGQVELRFSTVNLQAGAGLHIATGSQIRLDHTIVAASEAGNCVGVGFLSEGYNVEDGNSCELTGPGDQPNTDPQLGALADNGGAWPQGSAQAGVTLTHRLLESSPAVDAGDVSSCTSGVTAQDQRGVARPQGTNCDPGAYELEGGGPVHSSFTKTVSPSTIAVGETATFTITIVVGDEGGGQSINLVDTVPDGLEITEANTTAGQCRISGQEVQCDLGMLPAQSTTTITITVTATTEGSYGNVASASSPDTPDTPSAGATLVVTGPDTPTEPPEEFPPAGAGRVEGPTRIETAIEGSQAVFDDGEAGAVVLTRSDLFPDAQAGTPLAIQLDAPMLLSQPAELNPLTEAEIQRVLPDGATVYLLGGTAALSQAVEDRIDVLGFDAIRLGGTNRFQTAAIIADAGLDDPPTLLCADGGDFPDSVVAGAATLGAGDAAVILTSGSDLPPETSAYLQGREDDPEIIAVGGSAAVACDGATESLVGATRFETAIAVAERFFTTPPVVGMATGLDFPDALTGGAIIGRADVGPGPMLLTAADALPDSVAAYLTDNADTIDSVVIFGGTAAISQAVQNDVTTILGGGVP